MKLHKTVSATLGYIFLIGSTQASALTGEDVIRILISNKDKLVTSQSGWCNNSTSKPLSNEIIRVLSPQSHFDDNTIENTHFSCQDSNHQIGNKSIPVWECQLGIVTSKTTDKNYFLSRSIFVAINKKSHHLYMDSIRCLD